jgi:hypothetical protein
VTAPVETLEDLVRAELRPVVGDVVRLLVLDLAREELGRIAASLNGRPRRPTEMVLPGSQEHQELPRALGEGSDPPENGAAPLRRCRGCDETKPPDAFEAGRHECRACRAARKRREYRARRAAAEASNGDPG